MIVADAMGALPPKTPALPARRAMGVSQDRFAALLGISPATVRNLEQHRTRLTGSTAKLLSITEQYPQIFISSSSTKRSLTKVPATLDKAATVDGGVKLLLDPFIEQLRDYS